MEGAVMDTCAHKPLTLTPLLALIALSALVTIPTLSASHLYAAGTQQYTSIVIHPGESLWNIAESHTKAGGDVQETLDAIVGANHLKSGPLLPGQHLKIPL
jgi:hypothetical protein